MSKPTYAEACAAFRWADSLHVLGWTADGGVSLGETIVDRHAASGRPALAWHGKDGASRALTYAELAAQSSRCANALRALGVRPGDRVAGFLPRVPETVVFMLGCWKAGAVYVPIFTGFGGDAITFRIDHTGRTRRGRGR